MEGRVKDSKEPVTCRRHLRRLLSTYLIAISRAAVEGRCAAAFHPSARTVEVYGLLRGPRCAPERYLRGDRQLIEVYYMEWREVAHGTRGRIITPMTYSENTKCSFPCLPGSPP